MFVTGVGVTVLITLLIDACSEYAAANWGLFRRARETVICVQSPVSGEEIYIKSRFWGRGNGRQVVSVSTSRVNHTDPDTLSEYVFYDENSPAIFQCLGDTLVLYVGISAPVPPLLRTGFTIMQRHDEDLATRRALDQAFARRMRAVREGASCYE